MRKRLTPATVLAMVALFVALAGSATAAGTVLITGKQIKDASIGLADLNPAAKRSLRGQAGSVGPLGAPGSAGAQGVAGAPGAAGAQGAQGVAGAPGAAGAQGAQGAQGAAGERGLAGTQGPAGEKGATGAQGPAGERGPAGPQGAPGADFSSLEDLRGKPCQAPGGNNGVITIASYDNSAGYAPSTSPSASYEELPGSGIRSMNVNCVTADRWENNDDRAVAADISTSRWGEGQAWSINGTMLPAGDDDWYKLPATKLALEWPQPDSKIKLSAWDQDATIRMDVYRDGLQVASNSTEYALTASDRDTPHNWEIRVFGSTVEPYFIQIN